MNRGYVSLRRETLKRKVVTNKNADRAYIKLRKKKKKI